METCKPSHLAEGNFNMIDVGEKETTRRRAIAQGRIHLSKDAFIALVQNKNPKGNVLALAEVAGIMCAKKTCEIIPLCHPLDLEKIEVRFEIETNSNSILVTCDCRTSAKTGVEMEALAGVNGALLTIYDLSKAVNPVLSISDIRLNLKEGGKSGVWVHPENIKKQEIINLEKTFAGIRAAVVTISDRVSAGLATDSSGPYIVDFLKNNAAQVVSFVTCSDEKEKIKSAVRAAAMETDSKLIITTGGTGLSPRDVTPEALHEIFEREIPGIGELLRKSGSINTEMSWISRSSAGQIGNTLVIALPGSLKAVKEGLDCLKEIIPHAIHILSGGDHNGSAQK